MGKSNWHNGLSVIGESCIENRRGSLEALVWRVHLLNTTWTTTNQTSLTYEKMNYNTSAMKAI